MILQLLLTLFIAQLNAQTTCFDQLGQEVTYVSNSSYPGPAVALAKNGSKPIIITNPNLMNKFSPQTQKFILAHECSQSIGRIRAIIP